MGKIWQSKDYKKQAKALGQIWEKAISNFEFHMWNGEGFDRSGELPHPKKEEAFKKARERIMGEQGAIKQMYQYFAYITAPSEEDAEMVLAQNYDAYRFNMKQILMQKKVITNSYGFPITMPRKDRELDYDRFEYAFKTIADHIQRGIDRLSKVGAHV